jgi:hypothetical protein
LRSITLETPSEASLIIAEKDPETLEGSLDYCNRLKTLVVKQQAEISLLKQEVKELRAAPKAAGRKKGGRRVLTRSRVVTTALLKTARLAKLQGDKERKPAIKIGKVPFAGQKRKADDEVILANDADVQREVEEFMKEEIVEPVGSEEEACSGGKPRQSTSKNRTCLGESDGNRFRRSKRICAARSS